MFCFRDFRTASSQGFAPRRFRKDENVGDGSDQAPWGVDTSKAIYGLRVDISYHPTSITNIARNILQSLSDVEKAEQKFESSNRKPRTGCNIQRLKNQPSPTMATITYRWIKVTPMPKHSPQPTAKETMDVNQRDNVAQMEYFEIVPLCSRRPHPSRRNRPALPPEEERSSYTDQPG